MPGLVFLVRHGETAWSREARLTSRTDLPLTSAGKAEAVQAGAVLRTLLASGGAAPTDPLVLCSPLQRARSTAELAELQTPAEPLDALREADFGDLEGLTVDEVRRRHPGWQFWRDACPGGESLYQIRQRLELVERTARSADRPMVLFGHGAAHRALICMMIGLPLETGDALVFDTGAIAVLQAAHDGRFRLRLHSPSRPLVA